MCDILLSINPEHVENILKGIYQSRPKKLFLSLLQLLFLCLSVGLLFQRFV